MPREDPGLQSEKYNSMNEIFTYNNYRTYLKDYYLEKKRTTGYFTYRYFAQIAGFSSPVFIKLVIDGKTNLSSRSVEKLSRAMGLTNGEREYFENLVRFNQAKKSEQKRQYLQKLRDLNKRFSVEVLDTDKYDYYTRWYHSVLREVAPNADVGDDYKALGELLLPPIKRRETGRAVKLLLELGLLERADDGTLKQAQKLVSTGSEVESLAVRDLHAQMANLARDAIEQVPKDERDISGITVGLSNETYATIRQEIKEFRERLMKLVADDTTPVERVYRLNLQLFPLSERLDAKNEKNKGVHDA